MRFSIHFHLVIRVASKNQKYDDCQDSSVRNKKEKVQNRIYVLMIGHGYF